MIKPVLTVETEFELMADYQMSIESKTVIVMNSLQDKFRYSLYSISEPFPTYDEYMNGNDFDEDELIESSNNPDDLRVIQKARRK